MKGFFIEVSNDLLDPKHCDQMKDAVWLFMWFLDKMTVIDHDIGEGKVLGGKPIKYPEIKKDLGISRSTYMRWLDILRAEPYIRTLRTPYGHVVTVLKAKKRFGRSAKNEASENERSVGSDTSPHPEVTHLTSENGTSNKTVSVDSTEDTNTTAAETATAREKEIAEILYLFKDVNPSYKIHFNRKPQRAAADRLIEQHGFKQVSAIIAFLKISNGKRFAPTITTAIELERDLGKLKAFADKHRDNGKGKKILSSVPQPTNV